MSLQSFISWTKNANLQERIRAARIMGKTWCPQKFLDKEKDYLILAMMHLLDDPAPAVRLSLARSIALSNTVPRNIILALSEDHPDVSGTIILHSPILNDDDLIYLIRKGSDLTRVFIASRYKLSNYVAENLIENGQLYSVIALLENKSAFLSSSLLMSISERFCHVPDARSLLSSRSDLPLKARYLLMKSVSNDLCKSVIVNRFITSQRAKILSTESIMNGIIDMILNVDDMNSMRELVVILQHDKQLTPALLINALIIGAINFVSLVIENISGERIDRIRSILYTGGFNVVRALYESIGLESEVSVIFVEATMIIREMYANSINIDPLVISEKLIKIIQKKDIAGLSAKELYEIIERICLDANRKLIRSLASKSSRFIVAA
ncbi:DUF2336 domain-containing protein [Candidatus Liberibacter americanus]|uniref:DUF2336 domain-containing protein n=1 Tax=Candidatus Liberibacter americanus TaxID=309868 RepID=UPI0002C6079C|nr:DUF2336 domain-containing protein [Candidatus Liberibacter americanus]EMS36298.1 hypothetical protein G653_02699 [Candidatus Liberibacter americanus PW_SP]